MNNPTVDELISRYDKLKTQRANTEKLLDEIASYNVPNKGGFISPLNEGDANTELLYDSTSIHSSNLLAASIHSSLTSPSMVWFDLRFRDEDLNELEAAKTWLEDCAERMDAEINESPFNSEVNELYQDLVDFGTSVQLVDMNDSNDLHISTQALAGCVIAEDEHGMVDTVMRCWKMTARQIKSKYPDADLPKVTAAVESAAKQDMEFTVLHIVQPRTGKDVVYDEEVVAKYRPWAEYTIIKEESTLVEEGGHYELPFMSPRWAKRAGDVWGYSPSMIALPDIKTLNRAKKLELTAWEKAIDPPMKAVESDIIGDVDLQPSGLTMVRDMNGIAPMVDATNWQAAMMKGDELKQSIRNIYFTDQLQLPERPNATATEVSIRYETMQRLLGSTFGRLANEYLDPFVKRVFNLMMRAGKFSEVPQELVESGYDSNIDIEYVSPLARSQRMDEVQAIQGFMGFVGSGVEIFPEGIDLIDVDDAYRLVADRMGVPSRAIRGDTEVDEKRAKRKAEQEEMMQKQLAMQQQGGAGGQPVQ